MIIERIDRESALHNFSRTYPVSDLHEQPSQAGAIVRIALLNERIHDSNEALRESPPMLRIGLEFVVNRVESVYSTTDGFQISVRQFRHMNDGVHKAQPILFFP